MPGKEHNLVLGIIFAAEFFIFALMFILVGVLFVFMIGIGATKSIDATPILMNALIYLVVLAIQSIFPIVFGMASWKMLKNKPNARIWGIIASICSLPAILPLGFIVGIYGLWFMLSQEGQTYYALAGQTDSQMQHFTPPNRNQNW